MKNKSTFKEIKHRRDNRNNTRTNYLQCIWQRSTQLMWFLWNYIVSWTIKKVNKHLNKLNTEEEIEKILEQIIYNEYDKDLHK